jgi:mono/diheme cytochrome c family protein
MQKTGLLLASLAAGLFVSGALAAQAADPTKAESKLVGPPDVAWKDMTPEQKGRYMKEVVVPKAKVAFQAYDADEYKKFNCATCHGDKAKARKFKMPSPDLPALPGNQAGFAALMEKKPKMMKFMAETVKPAMAKMLGVPEFDPKKPEAGGFGCTGCHTTKKE